MVNINQSLMTINSQVSSIKEYCKVLDKTYLLNKVNEIEQELALLEVSLKKD
jgi:hypothetical protein